MKWIIYSACLLVSGSALAEVESAAVISAKQESVSSTGKFHWITHNCSTEENGEIETTPGSPPLNIDDPATPGCNNWEINVVADGDLSRQEKAWNLPLLDINYGIGDNLQLKYEVPHVISNAQNSSNSAIGNSKAGVKYQFYGSDESKFQMAIYPQVEFSTPGKAPGSDARESHGTITTLPVLLAKRVGRISSGNVMMTANLGYNLSTKADTADFISGALGVGTPLIGKTSLLAEIATEQAIAHLADDPREQVVKINLGLMGPIGKHFALFGSLGRSLIASDERNHTYLLSGFRFLPE